MDIYGRRGSSQEQVTIKMLKIMTKYKATS